MKAIIRRSNKCQLCGCKLITEKSIRRGYGQKCYGKLLRAGYEFVEQISLLEKDNKVS